MTLPSAGTNLVIQTTTSLITFYSSRGLKQTLTPIRAAQAMRRTVNGALVDISLAQFQKYASTISCTDQRPPALDAIWPGQTVTVSCVALLSYPSAGAPSRPVVSGSSFTENGFTFYSPLLTMKIMTPKSEMDEWKASVGWELALEEI